MANKPNNPSLWSRAKSLAKQKFDVYPSAYANGWAAKWYKSKGGTWSKAEYGMEVMSKGGTNNPGFEALPEYVQAKILAEMGYGGMTYPFMQKGGEPNGEMALGQMAAVQDKMGKLLQFVKPNDNLDPWIASKLAVMDHSADAISDYMMYGPEAAEQEEMMEEMKEGGIPQRYKNMGFNKVGVKKNSTRPGKKWMVLAKKGSDYKVVHGGYDGMKDYTQHGSEKRREKFWSRMGGKNSSKATDPFSPLYWHKRFGTWQDGGEIDEMANGGYIGYDGERHISTTPTWSGNAGYEMGGYIPEFAGGGYCYECGGNVYKMGGGIQIDPKNKGKFTEAANRAGMGVQEFANHVMANKEDYSSTLVKRANFARNAAKWNKEDGGELLMAQFGMFNPGFFNNLLETAGNVAGLQNTLKTGSARDIRSGVNSFNEKYGTDLDLPPVVFGAKGRETLREIGDATDTLKMGVGVVSAATDFFINNPRIKRENKQRQVLSGMTDSMYMAAPEDRGDYVAAGSRIGQLRPDEYVVNKGMYTGQFYPTMAQLGVEVIPDMISPSYALNYTAAPAMADNTYVAPKAYMPAVKAAPKGSLKDFISGKESGGNYKALPKDKSGKLVSSAAGKYQFLWDQHKDWISKVTGVKSKQEFLNNPQAQEEAFDYWDTTVLTPNAQKIKQKLGVKDSLDEIKAKIHFAGPAGAYKYYSTGEETKDAFGTMTSTYEYGGQAGYGLDLGARKVYADMPDSSYESVSSTIGPVDREDANIEAEKGETIYGDIDGDGMNEHMKIGGKRHSQGGTPLNAPVGSFIYSDTKKMMIKDPEILKFFGKTKSMTPAQIAKGYDVNKYKAVIDDPNADPLSVTTAKMMMDNYNKKLGGLALVQEGMKGFPMGIPEVAQSVMPQVAYGGYIDEYQLGGSNKPKRRKLTQAEFDAAVKKGEFKKVGDRVAEKTVKVKDATPGSEAQYEIRAVKAPGAGSAAFNKAFAEARKAGLKEFTFNGKRFNTNLYVPGKGEKVMIKEATPGQPEQVEKEQIYFEPQGDAPEVGRYNPPSMQNIDAGSMPFFGTNLFVGPQRESVYAAPINAMLPEPTFFDPNRELAANAEQANITQQYLSGFGNPQSFMANASGVQGKALENAANINARYNNLNVGVANQFAPIRTDVMNKVAMANADRSDKLFYNNEQVNKAYRNQLRSWMRNVDAFRANEYDTKTKQNITNAVNPFFQFVNGPRGGNIVMRPGVDPYTLITGRMAGQQQGRGLTADQYLQAVENYKKMYPNASPLQVDKAIGMQNPSMGKQNASNARAMSSFLSQYLAASPFNATNPIFAEGFDVNDLYDQ